MDEDRVERLAGTLLGTAVGDALGLPAEGMKPEAIRRRFGTVDRYRLIGSTGFVSDDTEQAALVAESLVRHSGDPEACAEAFRRALLAWFFRLPFGVGLATVRACLRSACGIRPPGVPSAGNGAAMRAAVVGVFFREEAEKRRAFGTALAQVTHRDPRAVEGALCVAETAALCASRCPGAAAPGWWEPALAVVREERLCRALVQAGELAAAGVETEEAARELGTSGYVLHTVPFALFCFLRFGEEPMTALVETLRAGGDTDSIGAIVGGWAGALHGEAGLPGELVARLHNGPFGPDHLRGLACALAEAGEGRAGSPPGYSALAALGRNLALYPVILGHGFRRLLPW